MKSCIIFIYFMLSSFSMNLFAYEIPTISDLKGYWLNADPKTTGITRIMIGKDTEGRLIANVFGHCYPIECKWQPLLINNYEQSMPVSDEYINSFKSAYLSFDLATPTIMGLNIKTIFINDNTEGDNHETSYIFFKEASASVPVRILAK